jgi:hypothetical protein
VAAPRRIPIHANKKRQERILPFDFLAASGIDTATTAVVAIATAGIELIFHVFFCLRLVNHSPTH